MRRPRVLAAITLASATLAAAGRHAGDAGSWGQTGRRLADVGRPLSSALLPANDAPLGSLIVTLTASPGATVVDDDVTRAAVYSGLVQSTDWLSVGDVADVNVIDAATGDVGAACGASGQNVTYRIGLTPAILPSKAQAAQLERASAPIHRELRGVGVAAAAATVAKVSLDSALFTASPAPFPTGATGNAAFTATLRLVGGNMTLCPPGVLLPVLRKIRVNSTYGGQALRAAAAGPYANTTGARSFLSGVPDVFNAANTRFVSITPQRLALDSVTAAALDQLRFKVAVTDATVQVASLTPAGAAAFSGVLEHLSRAGVFSREAQAVDGVDAQGTTVLADPARYEYAGRPLGALPPGKLAAAIVVPLLAVAAAVAAATFIVRRRLRDAAIARALAGGGKPSDLLRALASAPLSGPMDRLAVVEWELDPAALHIVKDARGKDVQLGSGACGVVYRGRYAGQDVAVKVLKSDHAADREDLAKEVLMLRSFRHINIVGFIGAILRKNFPSVLVTELLERGSLYQALDSLDADKSLSWRRARTDAGRPRPFTGLNRRIALDVARGLAYLHARRIIHMDVKSLNVLLAKDYTAKLADVGLAKVLAGDSLGTLTSPAGTLAWMAPEVMATAGHAINEKADIFSYGVVLWELSAKMQPRRPLPPLSDNDAPLVIRNLMAACLAENPTKRPSAEAIVAALEALNDDCEPVEAPAKLAKRLTSWAPG